MSSAATAADDIPSIDDSMENNVYIVISILDSDDPAKHTSNRHPNATVSWSTVSRGTVPVSMDRLYSRYTATFELHLY